MSDNTSVIDAVRLIAKATNKDPDKASDIVKGALHPEQIDDMARLADPQVGVDEDSGENLPPC